MVLFEFDENLIPTLDLSGGWIQQMADATGHSSGMILGQWQMFCMEQWKTVPRRVTRTGLHVFYLWAHERYEEEVALGKAEFLRHLRAAIVVYGLDTVMKWREDAER